MLEYRYATQKDAELFYGKRPMSSMRAIVAVEDGIPIGIGGVYRQANHFVCFSEMKPEMRKHKKGILTVSRMVYEIIQRYNTVYAVASKNEKNSARLITHFGFVLVEINSDGEEVYVCKQPRH